MPAEIDTLQDRPAVQVVVSGVIELSFCLYVTTGSQRLPGSGWAAEHRPGPQGAPGEPVKRAPAWFAPFREAHPELVDRVAGFWSADTYIEWEELLVLAHRCGALLDGEPESLLDRLGAAIREPFEVPELPSERPGVRELIAERIRRLRASPELAEAYLAILREMWAGLLPYWELGGRDSATALANRVRAQLTAVDDFRAVLSKTHFARREGHAALVEQAAARGEAILVPLGLAGAGTGFFALPGALIIAFGPESETSAENRRERAELAAKRFKILSDPTRLSILTSLTCSPFSITDLANAFDLSQPTVSVHMKMLREAGLLESHKVGGHMLYHAPLERVRSMIDDALQDVLP